MSLGPRCSCHPSSLLSSLPQGVLPPTLLFDCLCMNISGHCRMPHSAVNAALDNPNNPFRKSGGKEMHLTHRGRALEPLVEQYSLRPTPCPQWVYFTTQNSGRAVVLSSGILLHKRLLASCRQEWGVASCGMLSMGLPISE